MHSEFLQKLIGLVAKTGNTMIVPDPTTGKSYVVMDMESYERLLAGSTPVPAYSAGGQQALQPFPQPQMPMAYQVPFQAMPQAPQQPVFVPPAPTPPESHFSAQQSRKEPIPTTPRKPASVDLTQEELLDKINRDIGDWKTAQERKRTEVLQTAAEPQRQIFDEQALEEEERFYLEPIE
jgi:hypothetical protein